MQMRFKFRARDVFLVAAITFAAVAILSARARAEGGCPNEALRQELQSGRLPDCRAYELVTPPHKGGVPAYLNVVSADASRVIVHSTGEFGDAGNSQETEGAAYELTRTAGGWSEAGIDLPASQYPYARYLGATPELNKTLWFARGSSQSLSALDLLVRDEAGGVLHDLGPDSNPAGHHEPPGLGLPPGQSFFDTWYVGSSTDFSHVLFWVASSETAGEETKAPLLWPGDTTTPGVPRLPRFHSLYERTEPTGFEPTLVGVSNEGPLDGSPHINEGAVLLSECGTNLGNAGGGNTRTAVSESGASVLFTAEHNAECAGTQPSVNELYARVAGVKTLAISEPALSGPGAVPGRECSGVCATDEEVPSDRSEGVFVGAAQNGSKVFFLSAQPLVNGDEDATTDLYEAEIEGQGAGARVAKLVQVSHDPHVGQAAEVQGVTRISGDGSHVYFVAKGVLASNSNGFAAPFSTAHAGGENLYVYEPDPESPGSYRTVFIGMLCSEAGMSGSVSDPECHSSDAQMWNLDGEAPARTTADGRFLVFSTATDLTAPEDTSTVSQVFRYDSESGHLARVSIGQGGYNHDGNTTESSLGAALESANVTPPGTAAVSEDGAVVFQSADGLTSAALNGQQESVEYEELNEEGLEQRHQATFYANNVYQWEADGTEVDGHVTCTEPAGCVHLVSDGLDTTADKSTGSGFRSAVQLYGQTPSGGDIFFTTADQLVPQDTDTQQDIYDARIDGGFPPPPVPVPCGESCQGAPGSPPLFGTPPSATLSGPGNLAPAPAPVPVKSKTAAQIKSAKLAKALKACKKDKKKTKRTKCEKQARKQFGTAKQAKKASNDRRAR